MITKEDIIKEIINYISSFFSNRVEDKFQNIKDQFLIKKLENALQAELIKFFDQHKGSVVLNSGVFYQFIKTDHSLDRICKIFQSSEGYNINNETEKFAEKCCVYLKGEGIAVDIIGRIELSELALKLYSVGNNWLNGMLDLKASAAVGITKREISSKSDEIISLIDKSKNEILLKIKESTNSDLQKNEEADNNFSSSYERLLELLKTNYDRNKAESPSMRLINIDESIYPVGRIIHDFNVKLLEKEEAVQLNEFLKESWINRQNHISVNGIGGIGKTVALFSIKKKDTPVVYIPLRFLVKEISNPIEDYIKRMVLTNKNDYDTFLAVCGENWTDSGPQLILLLDGVNEVKTVIREKVLKELDVFFFRLPGIQIILTSRYDIRSEINFNNVSYVEFECLKRDKIEEFLANNHIHIPAQASNIWSVLDTPLMLNLFVRSEIIKKGATSKYAFWRENVNAGAVIWNYLQSEISRYHNNHDHLLNCAVAASFIAPFIAFKMMQLECFELDIFGFDDYIKEAIETYEGIEERYLPKQIWLIIHDKGRKSCEKLDKVEIYQLLTKDMCLFYETNVSLQMMHQHFRDCFAAVHIFQTANICDGHIPEEWRSPFDQYVMEFLANLIQTEGVELENSVWNKIWSCTDSTLRNDREFIIKMLTLYKLAFGNNISEIDFSDKDLSSVPLMGYQLTGKYRKHFSNTILGDSTFMGNGHTMTVSSVSWSPDNSHFLSASYDCSLRIWDAKEDTCVVLRGFHRHYIRCAEWNPQDESSFASGGDDKDLICWHYEDNKNDWIPHIIGSSEDWLMSLAWSGDGKEIVCGDRSGNILLFDNTGVLRKYVKAHNHNVRCLSWESENRMFVSGSDDGTVCIWVKDFENNIKQIHFNSPIVSVCWTGGIKYLVVAIENCIYLIDSASVLSGNEKEWEEIEELRYYTIQREAISHVAVGTAKAKDYLAVYYNKYVEIYFLLYEDTKFCIYPLAIGNTNAFNFNKIVSASWNKSCNEIVCGSRDGAVCKMRVFSTEENRDRIKMELVAECTCH